MKMKQNIFLVIILLIGFTLTTPIYSQIIDDVDFSVKCGTKIHSKSSDYKQYEKLQSSWQCTTTSKYFRIHYDTTGLDAVDRTDKDKNGIPDYIDSVCAVFDYVYEIEVYQMGFEPPRTDYPGGEQDNQYYNVFVEDLALRPIPMYGATQWISDYFNVGKVYKSYSYIVIDNDYSPNDTYTRDGVTRKLYATSGIDGLKVTASHEFFHAIQYATGIVNANNDCIYEMTAVCMEMFVYPELYDYVNYVNVLMSNLDSLVFGNGFASNGYSYGIFFYMLSERYNKNIIKEYFDLTIQVSGCYKGLDSILVLNNSSLQDEWMIFIEWLYHSGNNAIDGKYFSMSSKFKTPFPKNTLKNYGQDAHFISPYQIVYTRFINSSQDPFILADTAELFYTNINTEGAIAGENGSSYPIICNGESSWYEIPESEELFDNFWLKVSSTSPFMDYYLVAKPGGKVKGISHCYPSPFNKTTNDYLCFPIADDIIIGEKVRLTIYNSTLIPVFSEMVETSSDNHQRVIKFKPDLLVGGVYTFTISRGDTDLIGKIVVK